MGYFNKPSSGSRLARLSKERIAAAMEEAGWRFGYDEDGDLETGFEGGFYGLLVSGPEGEIFTIRGTWYPTLSGEQLGEAVSACVDWNRETLWPKTFPNVRDDGVVRLHTEHSVDYEHGATDEQLRLQLTCALRTSEGFFRHLNEVFPEAAAALAGADDDE